MTLLNLFYFVFFGIALYYLTVLIFDFVLRGFAPFITSRPWLVNQINEHMDKLDIKHSPKFKALSLGSGRSGFFASLEKKISKSRAGGTRKGLYIFCSFLATSKIKKITN